MKSTMQKLIVVSLVGLWACRADAATAVVDVSAVPQWITQINQTRAQLQNLEAQLASTTGNRGFGQTPGVMPTLPANYKDVATSVFSEVGKVQRGVSSLTNASLPTAAYNQAGQREQTLKALIDRINQTNDPKDTAELHTLLSGQQAVLANERLKIDAYYRAQQAEERARQSESMIGIGATGIPKVTSSPTNRCDAADQYTQVAKNYLRCVWTENGQK